MFSELSDKAKKRIIGRYDWIKKFDVNEYVQNPPLIEKLYEEKQLALVAFFDLEEKAKNLTERVHSLELENRELTTQIREVKNQQISVFGLSIVATVLIGIGVNIATDKPYAWAGWVMIAVSVILEVIAFSLVVQRQ